MLNRMGAERARRAILAGAIAVTGVRIQNACKPDGSLASSGRDLSCQALVPSPQGSAKPGWAGDYLAGCIEPRSLDGETILDGWGSPLAYVCQVIEGATASRAYICNGEINSIDPRHYGLAPTGRTVLAAFDPATGAALTANDPWLPDPSDLLSSDRRRYAAPGWQLGYELWSPGPDRCFAWMRNDLANRDNVVNDDPDRSLR